MIDCKKTENYLKERKRMCERNQCDECSLGSNSNGTNKTCRVFENDYPSEVMKIVQKWSDEHPRKTYLMDFVKKYPNAPLEENGTPRFCPYDLGYMTKEDCYMTKKEDFDDCSQYCKQCWNTPIEESEVK